METTLQATLRTDSGKGDARKARAAGRLPAVVYGPVTAPQPVSVDPEALVDIFKRTGNKNTIIDLDVDGSVVPCLVREVQRHPLTREMLHVDFYAVPREDRIEVMVPIVPVGRPKGAILGGRVRLIRRKVKAACRYDHIPEKFEVDTTPLDIGDMVKASEIPLPEGVELVFDNDYNVVTVYGKKARGEKKK
jgi:large subunit ribosomal protein L25